MPELPEIRLNYDLLRTILQHKLIKIELTNSKFKSKVDKKLDQFNDLLPSIITNVGVKGKNLWFSLANEWYVWISFGMSGQLSIDNNNNKSPYTRLQLITKSKSNQSTTINYDDVRMFGHWYLYKNKNAFEKKYASIGPDILSSKNWSKSKIIERFRNLANDKQITQALMNQKIWSGVGNYIKSESLYKAQISPYAKVKNLSDNHLLTLFKAIIKVINRSYKTQKSLYKSKHEKPIPYEDYQKYMKVYNHKFDPYKNPVIRATNTLDKRTTYWVPKVQTIS